jgi:hypothetical protein
MTDNDDTQEQPDPAEQRLLRLLADTRGAPLGVTPPPTERVIRTVRFERAIRNVAQTIGALAAAFTDALTSLLGQPHQGRRR